MGKLLPFRRRKIGTCDSKIVSCHIPCIVRRQSRLQLSCRQIIALTLISVTLPKKRFAFISSPRSTTTHYGNNNNNHNTWKQPTAQLPSLWSLAQKERNDPEIINSFTQEPLENNSAKGMFNRRDALVAAATAAIFIPAMVASAADTSNAQSVSLEDLALGNARWNKLERGVGVESSNSKSIVSPTFAAYATRFLICYDDGVSAWWKDSCRSYSLLSLHQQQNKRGKTFGSLAESVHLAFDGFLRQGKASASKENIVELAKLFQEKYGKNDESERQISLLFAMLPADLQPSSILKSRPVKIIDDEGSIIAAQSSTSLSMLLSDDLTALLPAEYESVHVKSIHSNMIEPAVPIYEVGIDDMAGVAGISTLFGPVSSTPLKRERPEFSSNIYSLFALSGGVACAITHTVTLPLDVVKTKLQTSPGKYDSFVDGVKGITQDEGIQGLLVGAQATIAGYVWYGVSLYPSYTFFKRFVGHDLMTPDVAAIHGMDISLIAGALAAIIASIGLTPLEACRIRAVAEPEKYQPLGLLGTLRVISSEDPQDGWKKLYAGFPSLVTRQVIFGSVKFLAFERACEAIFAGAPFLKDAVWTSLAVSFVAGGFSGTLSSVFSQPADTVLTYVAQRGESMGVIQGCQVMVEEEGVASLFRGLGSRCIWAGTIIAGQFLLYDVFRSYFGVNGDDLSQVFEVVIGNQ